MTLGEMALGEMTISHLQPPDGNIGGPKGPRGTRGIGDKSEARFILSSKFEHSDSNLLRFLEISNLVHSKLKFELMLSNLLPCPFPPTLSKLFH